MYAIVEIAGQQFKVETGKRIFVHRLDAEKEKDVEFDKVLLVEDDGKVMVGEPVVKDFVVAAHVVDHIKGDKVIVFKKKRKKGYRVKNGHRQNFTQLEITGIGEKGAIKKQAPRKEKEKVKAVEPVVSQEPEPEKKPSARKSASGKAAEKKEEAPEVSKKKTVTKKVSEAKAAAKKSSKSKE